MKNVFLMFVLFAGLVTLSGCLTCMNGITKPIVMVDAPRDLIVTSNGSTYKMKEVRAFSVGGGNTITVYKYPGVNMVTRGHSQLELKYGDQTAVVPIENKYNIGWLIVEGVFTVGIAAAIDLITGGYCQPVNKFVDVPAYLNHSEPRTHDQLYQEVKDSYK